MPWKHHDLTKNCYTNSIETSRNMALFQHFSLPVTSSLAIDAILTTCHPQDISYTDAHPRKNQILSKMFWKCVHLQLMFLLGAMEPIITRHCARHVIEAGNNVCCFGASLFEPNLCRYTTTIQHLQLATALTTWARFKYHHKPIKTPDLNKPKTPMILKMNHKKGHQHLLLCILLRFLIPVLQLEVQLSSFVFLAHPPGRLRRGAKATMFHA